jgi:hypothetical protein
MSWKRGGCHCGAIAFEVKTADEIELIECNCTICSMSGFLHLIVPKCRFRLIRGEAMLSTYTFGTNSAKHLFCSRCGIKSFYVPRSHPDGYSVNYRCLETCDFRSVMTTPFDGRDWDESAAKLKPLES